MAHATLKMMTDYIEKNTNHLRYYSVIMSATSNKSRLLLFMMVVIALVFFISSFLAASFTNGPNTTTAGNVVQPESGSNCIVVRTGEDRLFGECGFS